MKQFLFPRVVEQAMSQSILITGATSGLGFEAAKLFTRDGSRQVTVTGRTLDRSAEAAKTLSTLTGSSSFESVALDLSQPSSVSAAVETLAQRGDMFDVVLLNAGMMTGKEKEITPNGVEITFASSLVGHHQLTMDLLANDLVAEGGRIIIAGSEAARGDVPIMKLTGIDKVATDGFDGDLVAAAEAMIRGQVPTPYKSMNTYGNAKVFVALWAAALARRLPRSITVNAVSPGAAPHTEMGRHSGFMMKKVMVPMMRAMPAFMGMGGETATAARRYVDASKFSPDVTGSFFASAPRKMSGPLQEMDYEHINNEAFQEAAWEATVNVSDRNYPSV